MIEDDRMLLNQSEIDNAVFETFSNHIMYAFGILSYIFDGQIPEILLPYPKELIVEVIKRRTVWLIEEYGIKDNFSTELQCLEMYTNNTYSLEEASKRFKRATFRNDMLKFFYIEQRKSYSELVKRINDEKAEKSTDKSE